MNSARCGGCGQTLGAKRHNCPTSVWNKGKRGLQIAWNKGLPSHQHPFFGKTHTPEAREKASRAWTPEMRQRQRDRMLGNQRSKGMTYKHTDAAKKRLSEVHKGSGSPAWKGGVSPLYRRIRASAEFSNWRKAVYERDNYTCQKHLVRGTDLHPHHIFNFADHPSIRFDVDNGITLCAQAHKDFHAKYGKANNTLDQLVAYLAL